MALQVLVLLPLAASVICVAIKRLRDRGRSGWWLLLFYLLPVLLIGGSVMLMPVMRWLVLPFYATLASYPIFIWALVELGLRGCAAGPARPDPLVQPA